MPIRLSQTAKDAVTCPFISNSSAGISCVVHVYPCSLQQDQEQKAPGTAQVTHLYPDTMTDTSFELSGLALRKPMLEFPKCWAWLDCLGDNRAETRVALRVLQLLNRLRKTVFLAAGVLRPNAARKQLSRDTRITKSCGREVDTGTCATMGGCEARSTGVFKCLSTSLSLALRWVK